MLPLYALHTSYVYCLRTFFNWSTNNNNVRSFREKQKKKCYYRNWKLTKILSQQFQLENLLVKKLDDAINIWRRQLETYRPPMSSKTPILPHIDKLTVRKWHNKKRRLKFFNSFAPTHNPWCMPNLKNATKKVEKFKWRGRICSTTWIITAAFDIRT